jgi:hypothetical protein
MNYLDVGTMNKGYSKETRDLCTQPSLPSYCSGGEIKGVKASWHVSNMA